MDPLELVSEEISPFFGSIDEIVTAISEHLPDPSKDSRTVSHSSTFSPNITSKKTYHSRESFSDPDAVKELVYRVLKYHYWNGYDIVTKESLEDQSTSNIASLPDLSPAFIDDMEINERDNSERGCLPDAMEHIFSQTQHAEDWGPLEGILDIRPPFMVLNASRAKRKRIYLDNRDSAICLDDHHKAGEVSDEISDEMPDEMPEVRPPLRRGERFTSEHLLSQKQDTLRQITVSDQSAQTSNDNRPDRLDGTISATSDNLPRPNIIYPLPNYLAIYGRRNTWPKEPYRQQPRIDGVFPVRPAQIQPRRKWFRMYNFFRRNYMCQSPVDEAKFDPHDEGMFHLQREHAALLTRALNDIMQHERHGTRSCCQRYLPRALVEDERIHEPKRESRVRDKWFESIEEALTAIDWRG